MVYPIYFFVFLFGLIIGSFINCLVYRLYKKKDFLKSRSFCPQCQHKISWFDNIPLLSFIFLKAKCRHCHKKISWQYPLVELITGILFVVVFWATIKLGNNQTLDLLFLNCSTAQLLGLFRNWLFTAILIIIFVYDFKYYLILDKITLPAIVIVFVLNLTIYYIQTPLLNNLFSYFLNLLLSAVVAGGFFLLQFVISKGKWIGGGDIRLGALMGIMLGWPQILVALFISYILGSIIGLSLVIINQKKFNSKIPFGTFLSFSTFVALLFGKEILNWYLNFTF